MQELCQKLLEVINDTSKPQAVRDAAQNLYNLLCGGPTTQDSGGGGDGTPPKN